jgi:hypothetical protein
MMQVDQNPYLICTFDDTGIASVAKGDRNQKTSDISVSSHCYLLPRKNKTERSRVKKEKLRFL